MSALRKIAAALFFMMLGSALTTGAFGLHVVHGPRGHFTILKTRPSLKDAYVDIRTWKREEWKDHPNLVQALVESGYKDVLPKPNPLSDNPVARFFENLTRKTAAPPNRKKSPNP